MPRTRTGLLLSAIVACLAACGGMSGDDIGHCTTEKHDIADDSEFVEVGFSADDVLAWAARSEMLRVQWADTTRVTTNIGSRTGDVELSLARGRGSAVAAKSDCEGSTDGLVPRLDVPVRITLASDEIGGTTTLAGTLTAKREGFVFVDSDDDVAKKLGLKLKPRSSDLEIYDVHLRIAMTERGSTAQLALGVQRRGPDSISTFAGSDVVLAWPITNPCSVDTVAEEFDRAVPDWLDRVRRVSAREWQGKDRAGMREYDLSVEAASQIVCVHVDSSLTLPTTLRLIHADDGELALVGYFEQRDGAAEFELAQDRSWGGGPSEFRSRFPSLGIDAPSFDHLQLSAELSVDAQSAAGAIEVTGSADTCKPQCNSTGCSGCGPRARTSLARIELSPKP